MSNPSLLPTVDFDRENVMTAEEAAAGYVGGYHGRSDRRSGQGSLMPIDALAGAVAGADADLTGVAGASSRSIQARLAERASILDWDAADSTGANDSSAAFVAAAASNAGEVWIPDGDFYLDETVSIGSTTKAQAWRGSGACRDGGSRVLCGGNVIHFKLLGTGSSFEGINLDGRGGTGNNVGAVGLAVGDGSSSNGVSGQKITASNCYIQYFTQAGLLLNGIQNSAFRSISSVYSKYNICITNGTRNCSLIDCNTTDWHDETAAWVTDWMDASDPDCRGVFIGLTTLGGLITNGSPTWASSAGFSGKVPSNITIVDNIYERFTRHAYIMEVKEFFGLLTVFKSEFTHAATALLKVDAWQGGQDSLYRPFVRLHGTQLLPTSSEALIDAGNGVDFVHDDPTPQGSTGSTGRWVSSQDYGAGKHILAAPAKYGARQGASLGSWVGHGSGGAVEISGNRLRITAVNASIGGKVYAQKAYAGTTVTFTAGTILLFRIIATAITASKTLRVSVVRSDSPFVTTVGTIAAAAANTLVEMTYVCGATDIGEIRVTSDDGTAATFDLAMFEVTAL